MLVTRQLIDSTVSCVYKLRQLNSDNFKTLLGHCESCSAKNCIKTPLKLTTCPFQASWTSFTLLICLSEFSVSKYWMNGVILLMGSKNSDWHEDRLVFSESRLMERVCLCVYLRHGSGRTTRPILTNLVLKCVSQ